MRRSALFIAFAVALSSCVGLFNPLAYAAATLSASSTRPFVGQQVKWAGDIGVANAKVALQQLDGKKWVNARTATAKSNGDFSFVLGTYSAKRSYRAVVVGKPVISNTVTLVTRSLETAPVRATLSAPKKPYVKQVVEIEGKTGVSGARKAILQRPSGKTWVASRIVTTSSSGKYVFKLALSGDIRLRVLVPPAGTAAPAKSPVVAVDTKKNTVGLVISRVGASSKIVGNGIFSADLNGRQVELQRASGKTWVKVGTAAQANNRVRFNNLKKSTNYRLVARTSKGAPQIVSDATSLSFGPASIGDRVAYVTTLNGGTPTKKGKDYEATIMINGQLAALEEIAVRGNSSATYPKRGYKIKFEDNVVPLPGIPKGKTFNLLPNYQDRTLIRTAVTFMVANQMTGMRWNPNRAFVELFINGKYLGAFDLIESVKIEPAGGKSAARISVNPATGVVLEIDPFGKQDKVPYWKSKKSKLPFKFKDPDEVDSETPAEGITSAKAAGMKKKIEKFESVLYGSKFKDPVNGWTKYMDLNSAVDFYLTKEFIKDWDGDLYRSNFVWTNNYNPNAADKLIMSPIWDVDRSAAAKTSGTSTVTSPRGWWMNGDGGGHLNNTDNVHTSQWFVRITKDPAFQKALKKRWDQKQGAFKNAGVYYVNAAVSELGKNVAANDRKLWAKTGDAKRYLPRSNTYNGEIAFVKKWYKDRYSWMNSRLE